MKNSRFLIAAALVALLLPQMRAASPKPIVLIDFTDSRHDFDGKVFHVYEYAYQDWDKGHVIDPPGKGTLIQARSGKGGLGENKTMVRFDRTPGVDLIYLIGNANKATTLNLSLTDDDGTERVWSISLTGKPTGKPQLQHFDLGKGDNDQNPGKKPGLDLKRISGWQIRGDFSDRSIEVLLIKLGGIAGG